MRWEAKKESLPDMILYVLRKAKEKGLPEKKRQRLELALEEVLTNIILHGYKNTIGEIAIEVDHNDHFCVAIKDQGIPFDPTTYDIVTMHANVLIHETVGGLGLYLARQLVDQMEYFRDQGYNILTIRMQPE